jgi:hypothetical protein
VKYGSPSGEVRGVGIQYDLSENNAISVTVPASGRVELSGGVINCDYMGQKDSLGSHRTRIGNEPVYMDGKAVNVPGTYSAMPDITLPDQAGGNGGSDNRSGNGGGCDSGALAWVGVTALFTALLKTGRRGGF